MHVHLAATKKSYLGNSKHTKANAQDLMALRNTLRKEYLFMVTQYDSTFVVWNKLTITTTSELQLQIQQEEESSGESDSQCHMVQGNDSLEVHSKSQLDCNDSSSSCDEYVDPLSLIHI